MKTQPMNSAQIKSLPNNVLYSPEYMNRRERRMMEKKNPRLQRLFESMSRNQTMDVEKALEADKLKSIVSESLEETRVEMKQIENGVNEVTLANCTTNEDGEVVHMFH